MYLFYFIYLFFHFYGECQCAWSSMNHRSYITLSFPCKLSTFIEGMPLLLKLPTIVVYTLSIYMYV